MHGIRLSQLSGQFLGLIKTGYIAFTSPQIFWDLGGFCFLVQLVLMFFNAEERKGSAEGRRGFLI
ncbi:hypothetical protein NIES4074_09910 [Cylindrospermum sp. NIES-4074]|nr:hypothetical protein NIES4074_09910 [Cylindrospermum sp. NIES-4074]